MISQTAFKLTYRLKPDDFYFGIIDILSAADQPSTCLKYRRIAACSILIFRPFLAEWPMLLGITAPSIFDASTGSAALRPVT
jgi:hypothetical protein